MRFPSNLLGADLEVDAEEILTYVMKQKGYRPVGPEDQPSKATRFEYFSSEEG